MGSGKVRVVVDGYVGDKCGYREARNRENGSLCSMSLLSCPSAFVNLYLV